MGALEGLAFGFGVAFTWTNLFACFAGVLVGTLVGILPGIGPVGAMALLLPSTFALEPATALIMLAGIYYGSMYGGSTTSILVNVPGEAASVVTAIDGYQMTRSGRAGAALSVSAVGSFLAGSVGVVGIVLFAAWLADQALRFGPPEYFAMTVSGLLLLSRLSGGSAVRSLVMVAIGLAVGTVGMEPISGFRRFTFGSVQLSQGIELVPVIMGLYGVAEVLAIAESGIKKAHIERVKLRELFPTKREWKQSSWPIARGSVVGFLTGLIPGPATVLATFVATRSKRRSRGRRNGSAAARSKASPARKRRTTAQRRARWSRCCRSVFRSRRPRRFCWARSSSTASSPARCSCRNARTCSGASSRACISATRCCSSSTCRSSGSSSACSGCRNTCSRRSCCCSASSARTA
jgi:putative tricarboxylic transport membrane protein